MNFDSNMRVRFDPVSGELVVSQRKRVPAGFFSSGRTGRRGVGSVSVIVGDNGAGKTSVAALIGDILQKDDRRLDYVLVVEQSDGKCVYSSNREGIKTKLPRVEAKGLFSLCYLTPHFTPDRLLGEHGDDVGDFIKGPFGRLLAPAVGGETDHALRCIRDFFWHLDAVMSHVNLNFEGREKRVVAWCQFDASKEVDVRRYCYDLINAHAKLRASGADCRVLQFGLYPKMSAGERSSHALWARLFEWLKEHPKAAENLVLFLDETETTLHPSLQRRLVKNFILFFEEFFPDAHVHIIFSTHSPNLLSDIPIGNVVLLRRDAVASESAAEPVSTCVDTIVECIPNTFGSNVFDLYYRHFKLDDGPVGVFASEKINALCQMDKKRASQNDILTRELIGDDYVRGYLRLREGSIRQ